VKYLLFLFFIFTLSAARAQLTYETLFVDYDSAWQFKNLKIIPIRVKNGGGRTGQGAAEQPDIVSLNQALSQGLVTITERGTASIDNVHWLRFNTHSDKPVYISGGEVIAGGRQDRMVIRDTILQPSPKDQYVQVMCVEEGRWTEKEKKFAYGNFANAHLRKVLDSSGNQVLIWKEIDNQLQTGAFKNKTLAYLSRNEDKKYVQVNDEYFNFFRQHFANTDSNVVGFVAISGNKVIGSDIFAWTGLFYHQLEPLLHGYIDDAVLYGAPVSLPDPPVKKYMDKLLKDEASQEEFVRRNGKIFRQNGRVIHVNTFLKEL
jgi:ARG/rhodanese/phosphatase superfamily protein